MDDLERIPVGVEYIGGVVSLIVFQSYAGRNVIPDTSGHCGLVEFIDLVFVSATKPQWMAAGLGLPCFNQKNVFLPSPNPHRSGCPSSPLNGTKY